MYETEPAYPEKPRSKKRVYLLVLILAVSMTGIAEALVLSNLVIYRVTVDQVTVTSTPNGDVTVPAGFTETRVYTVHTSQPFQGKFVLTIVNATLDATSINPNSFQLTINGQQVNSLTNTGPSVFFVGSTVAVNDGTEFTVAVHFIGEESFPNRIMPGTVYEFQASVSQ